MKRPRSYDPSWDTAILLGVGAAHSVSGPDDDSGAPVGVVWIPDPEQRHGWREKYLFSDKEQPEPRRLGFKPMTEPYR